MTNQATKDGKEVVRVARLRLETGKPTLLGGRIELRGGILSSADKQTDIRWHVDRGVVVITTYDRDGNPVPEKCVVPLSMVTEMTVVM